MKVRAHIPGGFIRAAGGLSAGAALLLTASCSIPIPQAEGDPTRYYILSTNDVPAAKPVAGAPSVHLREVEVASYLTARPMIVRRGEHEIEFRDFARWGESLDVGIGRVLREELIARGAAATVLGRGLRSTGSEYDFELRVRVLACEGTAKGAVLFRAVWDLATTESVPEPIARGDYRAAGLRWDGESEATLAAQLSLAVAGLAEEIARSLKR